MVLAIDIDGLAVVEIDTVAHQFVLEGGTVVMQLPIGVSALIDGEAADV